MRRLRWLVLLAVLALPVLAGTAQAQEKQYHWTRFDVNIEVLPSGDFTVEEIQTIAFTSGEFHFGFRNIPTDRLEAIRDVEVWEGNRQYAPGHGGDYTFETYTESGQFYIKWYFPYTSNSEHTFTLRYRVVGGLRYYEGGDQLYWKAVYADRGAPVYASTVTVRLPNVPGDPVAAYGAEAAISGRGTSTVVFTAAETLDPQQELEVRVQFPHGVVQGSAPAWQAAYDRDVQFRERIKPLLDLFLGTLGILFGLGGPLLLLLHWYTRGRDPKIPLPASTLPNPPGDDPPGVAGTLVDEKADLQDIIATLVDLARRGYLIIQEEQKSGFFTRRDFVFRLTDKSQADLLPHERLLLDRVFGRSMVREMSSLQNRFYRDIPKLRAALYDEVVRRGYYSSSPERVRAKYVGIGVGGLVLVVFVGLCALSMLQQYTSAVICPAVGLGVSALATIIVGQFMPAKTRKGADMAARWAAFKRYLADAERYTNLAEATELFDRYLPYAIAFGLDSEWVRKFTSMGEAVYVPAPIWYMPVYGPSSGLGGRPVRGRSATSAPGGALQAPSLQGMSDGMSASLQSMSDGLRSMLSSAASTLTSSPRSSGGGGGFSGGGGGLDTAALILGIFLAFVIAAPLVGVGVFMFVRGGHEARAFAEAEKQRKLLGMVQAKGEVRIADVGLELGADRDQVKAWIYDLVDKGFFNGFINWDEGKLYSRDAAQLRTNRCPNCGGEVQLAGKGVVRCPYCGVEIFLSG